MAIPHPMAMIVMPINDMNGVPNDGQRELPSRNLAVNDHGMATSSAVACFSTLAASS
jgi:hypothetical protein